MFKAEERQALADSLRAETLGCIHCAPKKQARKAQLIGMGASTPSRARRDRRGIGAPCVQPNILRAAFAVQHLPLWQECVAGIRGGRQFEAGERQALADSRRAETLGCKAVGGRSHGVRAAKYAPRCVRCPTPAALG